MNKAVFIVATQYDNLGDLIINKCLIDELSKHAQIYVDLNDANGQFEKHLFKAKNVHSLNQEYGFSFRGPSSIKYYSSYRNEFKYLFKSPGPIFIKNKRTFKETIRTKVLDLIYNSFRKKGNTFIIGSEVSLESKILENKLTRLQKFKKILVRSKGNEEYLNSLGFNNVDYIPDLCFLLREKVNPTIEKNVIGISFRDLNDPLIDKSINESTSALVDYYTKKDQKIVFFYQVGRDREYTYKLYEQFADNPNVTFRDQNLDLTEIDLYQDFRITVSNRLHVLLLGFIHNSVIFPILDDNFKTRKIPGILNSIEYDEDIPLPLTGNTLEKVEANYDKHVEKIDSINEKQLRICKDKIANLFSSQ